MRMQDGTTFTAQSQEQTPRVVHLSQSDFREGKVVSPNRKPASVSIDLDNLWAYLKTAGVPGWETYPGYLNEVTPRILQCLEKMNMKATFFVVGRDAAQPENGPALRAIADAGHEIGNHSFDHEPWMPLYSDAELAADFAKSEEALFAATGQRPRGFRGPGFCTSGRMRDVLRVRGYEYDASLLPTFLGPIARYYFQLVSKLPGKEKGKRALLYGGFSNGTMPLRPFEIRPGLMEVPVTTMPISRLPVHLSYLLFLAQHSDALARLYWRVATTLCRMTNVGPSLLLHPTDFMDVNDAPQMNYFPAMRIPALRKQALVEFVLGSLRKRWEVGTVADHADAFHKAPAPSNIIPMPLSTIPAPETLPSPATAAVSRRA